MSEFTLIRKKTVIKDEDGNVLLSAPILDLYYIITNSFIGNENLPPRNSLAIAAQQINAEYGSDLSWGEVSDILESLHGEIENLKKKGYIYARVAKWYGFDALKLSREEVQFYDCCIPRSKAEAEVYNRQIQSELTPDRVYDLVLELTGDENQALYQKAEKWLEVTRSRNS